MHKGIPQKWMYVLLVVYVIASLQHCRVHGVGTLQVGKHTPQSTVRATRPVMPSCVSKLCPRDCVTCDGVAQCVDVSDERGCDQRTDELLQILPPPPLPPQSVFLEMLKRQLQRHKDKQSKQHVSRETYTTTLPTIIVPNIHTLIATQAAPPVIPVQQLRQTQTTTLPAPPMYKESTSVTTTTTTRKSTIPTIPFTKPVTDWQTDSSRTVEPPLFPWMTVLPPTKRTANPWIMTAPSTIGPDIWLRWFLGMPSASDVVASSGSAWSSSSSNASSNKPFHPEALPVTPPTVSPRATTISPWLQTRPRTPSPRPPPIVLPSRAPPTTLAPLFPTQPLLPIVTEVDDDQDCMKVPDMEGFCRRRYQGLYRNPHNCGSFYICDWGYMHLCSCPPGTRFDVRHSICNWHWEVRC